MASSFIVVLAASAVGLGAPAPDRMAGPAAPFAQGMVQLAQAQPSAEDIFWQTIQNSNDPAMFQAYLDQVARGVFPGTYKVLADIKIATLRKNGAPAPDAGGQATSRPLASPGAPPAKPEPPPAKDAVASPEVEACDREAAAPADKEKPANIPGVAADMIDASAAIRACRAATEVTGAPRRVFFELARAIGKTGNMVDALVYYKKAYELGHPGAMHNMAGLLRSGARGVNRDPGLAVALYEQAAGAGLNESLVQLGQMYADGIGVRRDYPKALDYYQRALAARTPEAYTNLGVLYYAGRGVARDATKACEYWRQAASMGDDAAAKNLKRSCRMR